VTSGVYIPSAFRESDTERLLAFLDQYPFATLITRGDSGLSVSHVPLLVHSANPLRLRGHVAAANGQGRHFDGHDALAIFQGPHAYISPTWYPRRDRVPTWNYTVAHASGPIRALPEEETLAVVQASVARFEGAGGWALAELAPGQLEPLTRAIIAFEIEVRGLEGKFKLGQNLRGADREGAIAGLDRQPDEQSRAVARLMTEAATEHSASAPAGLKK
jgi:transcriptional regulator